MTMNGPNGSASPTSSTLATCSLRMRAAIFASFAKRSSVPATLWTSGRMNLMATGSSRPTCVAASTTPMAPSPSLRSTRYLSAITRPIASSAGARWRGGSNNVAARISTEILGSAAAAVRIDEPGAGSSRGVGELRFRGSTVMNSGPVALLAHLLPPVNQTLRRELAAGRRGIFRCFRRAAARAPAGFGFAFVSLVPSAPRRPLGCNTACNCRDEQVTDRAPRRARSVGRARRPIKSPDRRAREPRAPSPRDRVPG